MSMTSTCQCKYFQCFTFKRCNKFKLKCTSHGGMYTAHYFGKISITSKTVNAVVFTIARTKVHQNFLASKYGITHHSDATKE